MDAFDAPSWISRATLSWASLQGAAQALAADAAAAGDGSASAPDLAPLLAMLPDASGGSSSVRKLAAFAACCRLLVEAERLLGEGGGLGALPAVLPRLLSALAAVHELQPQAEGRDSLSLQTLARAEAELLCALSEAAPGAAARAASAVVGAVRDADRALSASGAADAGAGGAARCAVLCGLLKALASQCSAALLAAAAAEDLVYLGQLVTRLSGVEGTPAAEAALGANLAELARGDCRRLLFTTTAARAVDGLPRNLGHVLLGLFRVDGAASVLPPTVNFATGLATRVLSGAFAESTAERRAVESKHDGQRVLLSLRLLPLAVAQAPADERRTRRSVCESLTRAAYAGCFAPTAAASDGQANFPAYAQRDALWADVKAAVLQSASLLAAMDDEIRLSLLRFAMRTSSDAEGAATPRLDADLVCALLEEGRGGAQQQTASRLAETRRIALQVVIPDVQARLEAAGSSVDGITLLGRVVCCMDDSETAEYAIPMLLNQLVLQERQEEAVGELFEELLNQLVSVALLCDDAGCKDITNALVGYYRRLRNGSPPALLDALRLLAEQLAAAKLQAFCAQLLITMCECDLGGTLAPAAELMGVVGALLPALATALLRNFDDEAGAEVASVYSYRNLWAVLLNLGLLEESQDWSAAVAQIARLTPPLLHPSSSLVMNEVDHSTYCSRQNEALPEALADAMAAASAMEAAHVALLYHVELWRLTSVAEPGACGEQLPGGLDAILTYLEHVSESEGPAVVDGVLAIADPVFERFVGSWRRYAATHDPVGIETQTQKVLVHLCSTALSESKAAQRLLAAIFAAFPHVLWSEACLQTLFNVTNVVGLYCSAWRSDAKPQKMVIDILHDERDDSEESRWREKTTISLPSLPNAAQRDEFLCYVANDLCRGWVLQALKEQPEHTSTVIQQRIHNYQQRVHGGLSWNVGFDIVAQLQQDERFSGSFMGAIDRKATFIGQISAMKQLLASDPACSNVTVRICQLLIDEWKALSPGDSGVLRSTLMRSAAFVLSEESVAGKLSLVVQLIAWRPVMFFTPECMEVAVIAWDWLCSCAGDSVESLLMAELQAAWLWSVQSRKGLFGAASAKDTALRGPESKPSPGNMADAAVGYLPHRTWIYFLCRSFPLATSTNQHIAASIASMVQLGLANLCEHSMGAADPASMGARFKLLELAMQVSAHLHERARAERPLDAEAEGPGSALQFEAQQMERLIYTAALLWFEAPFSWYELNDSVTLSQDMSAFASFTAAVAKTKDRKALEGSRSEHWDAVRKSRRSASFSIGSAAASRPTPSTVSSTAKLRDLVLTLCDYNYTKLNSWHRPAQSTAPSQDAAAQTMLESSRSWGTWEAWARTRGRYITEPTALQWRDHAEVAWSVSPMLAARLAVVLRLRAPAIFERVGELVRPDPTICIDLPEAFQLFVTEQAAAQSPPPKELLALLYWPPVPLRFVLELLAEAYASCRPIVQYAVGVLDFWLQQGALKELEFYMPQLVQHVRHDAYGLLEQWLLRAGRQNDQLCHQLIWVLRTESGEASEMSGAALHAKEAAEKAKASAQKALTGMRTKANRPPMPALVKRLVEALADQMSDAQRMAYTAEFEYFDAVNELSDRLIQYETKAAREKQVGAELEKIAQKARQVKGDVYLPCNTDRLVIDVETDTAKPMQSAQKTPVLVFFKTIGPGESAEDARRQAVIFKTRDDCRQDVIALQAVRAFISIFANAGLDLRVKTYAIVATKPGCGIIECVPGATSRDAIGKDMAKSPERFEKCDLHEYFRHEFGEEERLRYQQVQQNFIRSSAGYAVVSYLLQVKDRHNGNILIDDEGHLVHIDFGFIFGISPGGDMGFEAAPFKLTSDMASVMGGPGSEGYKLFQRLCVKGFLACRPYARFFRELVRPMTDTDLPCFKNDADLALFYGRFEPELSDDAAAEKMLAHVAKSLNNKLTRGYDLFQKKAEGIAS